MAKKAAQTDPAEDFPMREVPYLDPKLAEVRDAEAKALGDTALSVSRDEPSIDPVLEKQRDK